MATTPWPPDETPGIAQSPLSQRTMNAPVRNPRIVAIASGKGGVGKTILTANLSMSLAESLISRGGKVVAVDLDLGCGNLNTCLGVRSPVGTITDFLLGRKAMAHLMTPTDQANLHVVCSSYTGLDDTRLEDPTRHALIGELRRLDADFVLLDLGAGSSSEVFDFFLQADDRIIVVTPEALSLHNAYLFAKGATMRSLLGTLETEEQLNPIRSKLRDLLHASESPTVRSMVQQLRKWDLYGSYVIAGIVADLEIKFVVNMYRGGSDKEHLRRFHQLLNRHLFWWDNIEYPGFVRYDQNVRRAVQSVEPLLRSYPGTRAALDIRDLARRLESGDHFESAPFRSQSKPAGSTLPG